MCRARLAGTGNKFTQLVGDGRLGGNGRTGLDVDDDGLSDDEAENKKYWRNYMRQNVFPEMMAVRRRSLPVP